MSKRTPKQLLKELWNQKYYYEQACESVLKAFSSGNEKKFYGLDLSELAIRMAKKRLREENFTKRFLRRLIKSHIYLLKKPNHLDWDEVFPKFLKCAAYDSDFDALVEPYIQTLIPFLKRQLPKN